MLKKVEYLYNLNCLNIHETTLMHAYKHFVSTRSLIDYISITINYVQLQIVFTKYVTPITPKSRRSMIMQDLHFMDVVPLAPYIF
jgi:hypothetical protein